MSRLQLTDEALTQALEESLDQGFLLLMQSYNERIYWHIRRLVVVHEDAQDASQETWIRVYRALPKRDREASLRSWLYTIATGEALRYLDRRREPMTALEDLLPSQQPLDPSSATAREVSEEEILLRLQQAILRLPQKQQLAFNLRYYEDMSYDEIARVIGSSPSSAKANYHLAKERIMKYLNEND